MRRLTIQAVVFLTFCTAGLAQTLQYQPPPHFNHIVIIFQENRTPDNIFGSAPSTPLCGQEDPFEPGVDIDNGGPNKASQQHGKPYVTCDQPLPNMQGGGGNHSHLDWTTEYDGGLMDGACIGYYNPNGNPICPPYTYVQKSVVQPYFDIATNYGFANYMFQTNQGPSFPAHQFIFGGTSAPVWPTNAYYQYFVAENRSGGGQTGCPIGAIGAKWIDPGGNELADPNKSECYDHNTLVTYQDTNGVVHDKTGNLVNGGWKYYAATPGILWDAPENNPQTCYFATTGSGGCASSEFTNHVFFAKKKAFQSAPIFNDIATCNLAAISWVTPDEAWSDHPGSGDQSLGPSWVADIVDAIGNSSTNSQGKCDYWKADPTAIFITWDDWGGFYDHVPPPITYLGTFQNGQWTCPAPNGWGCGYVYGFRVPMMVVSEYTPPGTISGAISGTPTYPPPAAWTHDFGSILAFTENNFQLPSIAPAGFTYADQNSLDAYYQGQPAVPLWEFFLGPTRSFTTISAPSDANFFMNYYTTEQNGGYPVPTGPDNDDD